MVHDRLAMYFNYTDASHALCLAHVVRDLEAAGVRWNQGWAHEMQTLLTETNKAYHAARAKGKGRLSKMVVANFLSSYDALVAADLAANPEPVGRKRDYLERESYNIAVALRDRREEATRFARDLSIPLYQQRSGILVADGKAAPEGLGLLPRGRLGPALCGDPFLHRNCPRAGRRRARCRRPAVPRRRLAAARPDLKHSRRSSQPTA